MNAIRAALPWHPHQPDESDTPANTYVLQEIGVCRSVISVDPSDPSGGNCRLHRDRVSTLPTPRFRPPPRTVHTLFKVDKVLARATTSNLTVNQALPLENLCACGGFSAAQAAVSRPCLRRKLKSGRLTGRQREARA